MRETVRIRLDGKIVAKFNLDENEHSEYTDVTLPREGMYNYEIEGDTVYAQSTGALDYGGAGTGVIELKSAENVELVESLSDSVLSYSLRIQPVAASLQPR